MIGWNEEDVIRAWRALDRPEANEDWRFVHLVSFDEVSVEAGCHFPDRREALIVSFPGVSPVDRARLPEGKGFDVTSIESHTIFAGRTAIALIRSSEGSPEIFAVMVVDVLRSLEFAIAARNDKGIDVFLDRVREWQVFMTRKQRPLSVDAQTGLMGELWILRMLVDGPFGAGALDCWQGPLRAAQDFHVRGGAIEVKSTVRTGTFLARINSIEQLDGERSPLFLCGLRFEESGDGKSLVELVEELRGRFILSGTARAFDALLMVMGYLDDHAALYARLLVMKESKVFLSGGSMPRLVRASLPAALRSANYVLDLDALEVPSRNVEDMLLAIGPE